MLLKFPTQTVSVDLWAVGVRLLLAYLLLLLLPILTLTLQVILLSLLSRSYPFFRAPDDLTALAEITTIFGSRAVAKAALK